MNEPATYLIVQHVPDLFRREPRNMGVFVRHKGVIDARFLGETSPGQVNGNKTKWMPYPRVYAQWVRYWRRTLERRPATAWDEIRETAQDHYRVIDGGLVEGIAQKDAVEDVLNYLYAALVSEGGFAEALGAKEDADTSVKLVETISDALMSKQLLAFGNGEGTLSNVKHPVKRSVPVPGKLTDYTPAFVQEGENLVVMEPVDLSAANKSRIRLLAGSTRSMFSDIKANRADADTVAIISATVDDEKQDHVRAAMRLLGSEGRLFNWLSEADRQMFIEERAKVAA